MSGIIQLLPEYVANQIAAGEVVNRPASAVKELLENAVDSGAKSISVYIQDAGKTLIKVIDDGCGMTVEDAEKCFLRHATSKIRESGDLYTLKTMGFRGEALASIAAIAQVELQTKREGAELGTNVRIEGESLKTVQACTCDKGTQISIKNLYFNTPARRQFLKSDEVEYRYIEEEFMRVSVVHPELKFSLIRDSKTIYSLEPGSFKQRVVQLLGKAFDQRLMTVKESVGTIKVEGFICTPEYAAKNRNKQYLFVNTRYIKHIGLNHAIETAYKQLLPEKNYPIYFMSISVDPASIDVNIHPTKTEIRFDDEKLIYGILLSVVKHAIGVNQLAPALDFDNLNQIVVPVIKPSYFPEVPKIDVDPEYNPFDMPYKQNKTDENKLYDSSVLGGKGQGVGLKSIPASSSSASYGFGNASKYESAYKATVSKESVQAVFGLYSEPVVLPSNAGNNAIEKANDPYSEGKVLQVGLSYIVSTVKSGLLFVDQQAASERIVYERYCKSRAKGGEVAQRILFPQTVELSQSQSETLKEIREDLGHLGWEIEWAGANTFIVNATPSDVKKENIQVLVEGAVDGYVANMLNLMGSKDDNITVAMARQMSVKRGEKLEKEEMINIINHLFASTHSGYSPSGVKTFWIMQEPEIKQGFKKR